MSATIDAPSSEAQALPPEGCMRVRALHRRDHIETSHP